MENAGKFYGHLKYFTVNWYILWPFGNVVVIWYIFLRFGILCQEKSGNPGLAVSRKSFLGPVFQRFFCCHLCMYTDSMSPHVAVRHGFLLTLGATCFGLNRHPFTFLHCIHTYILSNDILIGLQLKQPTH
jgi:hypothetical protein